MKNGKIVKFHVINNLELNLLDIWSLVGLVAFSHYPGEPNYHINSDLTNLP